MIVIIDNYDSFAYNLVQRFGEIDPSLDIRVVRNDRAKVEEIETWRPTHVVISPGPCTPRESGISRQVILQLDVPILGVCLGHQCIADVFGGDVVRHSRVVHGKTSWIHHDARGLFVDLPNPFEATRYHSLIVPRDTWSHPDFEISAWTEQGEIMGLRHRQRPLNGVQFHPESLLTVEGPKLLRRFLEGTDAN